MLVIYDNEFALRWIGILVLHLWLNNRLMDYLYKLDIRVFIWMTSTDTLLNDDMHYRFEITRSFITFRNIAHGAFMILSNRFPD